MPVTEPIASMKPLTGVEALGPMFLSAEDFDATGILAGVEPCASNYWWIPELHPGIPDGSAIDIALPGARLEVEQHAAANPAAIPSRRHAARRTSRQSTAA